MPREIDSRIADHLVSTALSSLGSPRGNNVICTRRALDAALLAAIREAHEIGFLAGQQERYAYVTSPGSPHRPAWMDIRFDDPEELHLRGIRIGPTVLKALAAAGLPPSGRPPLGIRVATSSLALRRHQNGTRTSGHRAAVRGSGTIVRGRRPARAAHRRSTVDLTTDHLFALSYTRNARVTAGARGVTAGQ
jgi:hypothetical protein